jgi:release factor glutamine methyltransferase
MSSIAEKLNEVEAILRASDIADPRRTGSLLISLALEKDGTFLIAHPEYVLQPVEIERVDAVVSRRASGEPFQYIAGRTEFYGLDFIVTPDVLIPRPETELLVESALEIIATNSVGTFCDIGIGSGCITVSILHHLPHVSSVGLDLSPRALAIASLNADLHGVRNRVRLVESDLFSALRDERFDLIVSNPPYVPAGDSAGLQLEVRDHEPHIALFGGHDGLAIVRRIVAQAPAFLQSRGYLLMEIGIYQSEKVAALFDEDVWEPVRFLPDLQGIPRVAVARLR